MTPWPRKGKKRSQEGKTKFRGAPQNKVKYSKTKEIRVLTQNNNLQASPEGAKRNPKAGRLSDGRSLAHYDVPKALNQAVETVQYFDEA